MRVGIVHIPKTFGTSLRRALENQSHGNEIVFCQNSLHESYQVNEERFKSCDFVVSVTRNPYARHISQCEEELAYFAKKKRGFFKPSLMRMKIHGYAGPLVEGYKTWPGIGPEREFFPFAPQYTYVTDEQRELYPNIKLFKFEDGVEPLEELLNIKIPHYNKKSKPNLDWENYIQHSDLLNSLIRNTYAKDFKMFGYETI